MRSPIERTDVARGKSDKYVYSLGYNFVNLWYFDLEFLSDIQIYQTFKKYKNLKIVFFFFTLLGVYFFSEQQEAGLPASTGNPTWSEVVRRSRKNPTSKDSSSQPPLEQCCKEGQIAFLRRRLPRTSVVTIDRLTEEGVTLTSVMKKVARCVDLKKIGVTVCNT